MPELVSRVVDDRDGRRALFERVQKALAGRVDPWKENVEKLDGREEGAVREFTRVSLPVVASHSPPRDGE